ncbi:MAG: ribosome maturation factor RimM [Cellvibrionales bacterium TMED148]|nr:ribosome maturation factor RimM [Porticoccaceae bacterium]RPG90826.1 MAG: ribosome maturation factor RimM [Cellvibrionales bacterium TMED148]
MMGSRDFIFGEKVVVGRLTSVFGVHGWIKVWSYTDIRENILTYRPWWVNSSGVFEELLLDDWKWQRDGLIVRLEGVKNRETAKNWCQKDILVDLSRLPKLPGDSFYWHQLIGLGVFSEYEGEILNLGRVSKIIETGSNDVLIVSGEGDSIDSKERLIPYVRQYVFSVDLQKQLIKVNWDPDF